MTREDVIETIKTATIDVPDIRALFLGGSYGNGMADAFSDIDFVLVAQDGATDAISEVWRKAVGQTGTIVLWWDRKTVPVLINAITTDWTRTDVLILKEDQLAQYAQNMLIPLFDHDGLFERLPDKLPEAAPQIGKWRYQFEDFIRILGLLHLAVGREEYINGVLGIFHLRNYLVELLIAQTNAPNRGGVLHLNRLLTEEQKDLLTSLPPPRPERDAMIAAHLAYAQAYLPRARRMADRLGVDWPEDFEAATWAQLKTALSITRPY
ncbi:MAG: aminoglycoside 6-adenylyltransferase [Yoonia sp.]|uniref:aminoglycoside 6-adenylyltransferase n=1 Tax=Yoonia sp. TaxID=2212373 RepID=UPI00273DED8C|nr:aminoglycoside 6-adenylyltransferase [Yoonia sp.]MDP5086912.1 aminoglycoside 6-adenylyltransferase [Yoonia sp.]